MSEYVRKLLQDARKKIKRKVLENRPKRARAEHLEEKEQRDWTDGQRKDTKGPGADTTGPTVQLCGSLGQKYRRRIGQVQKTLHSWWKEKRASPISKTDDFVKHGENTIGKLTTGPTLVHWDRGKLFLTDVIILRRGRR